MKSIVLILAVALTTQCVFAQQNIFPTQGNVGIGTLTPQERLEIKGNMLISNAEIPLGLNTEVGGTTPLFNMSVNFREANKNNTYLGAAFRIDTRISELPLFQWLKRDAGTDIEYVLMNINANGNVGIGITSPAEKLAVNGNIRAKEIKVEASNWPDYVFEEGYKVGTLQKLESYIKANKHLPGMPAAKEVETNGIAVSEMLKLQQQKIEELTLYIIQLKKELDTVKNKLKDK